MVYMKINGLNDLHQIGGHARLHPLLPDHGNGGSVPHVPNLAQAVRAALRQFYGQVSAAV